MDSLKQQIENATAGQVIPVKGPHGIDNIRWNKPVRLIGDGSAVFYGAGAKRALRYTGGGRLTIEGIRFVDYARAIELLPNNARRIRVIGCEFEGCGTAVYGGTDARRPSYCDDIELSDLYLRGCTDRAIDIYTPFQSCRVRDSTIDGGGQGAIWLGWHKFGIENYGIASVSGCFIRNIQHLTDCKALAFAGREAMVQGNHFADVWAPDAENYSDTCAMYFKTYRALVSGNTLERACGVVGKLNCDLTVSDNHLWTDATGRWHTGAIATMKNSAVYAHGNRMWGMAIGLSSRRPSVVRDNFLVEVPLIGPWGITQRAAVFYESTALGFHDISNRIPNGVLPEYNHAA